MSEGTQRQMEVTISELIRYQEQDPSCGLSQFRSLVSANQYRKLYDLFLDLVPREGRVLDWGSGNGHFSYFLLRCGYTLSSYSLEALPFQAVLTRLFFDCDFKLDYASDPTGLPYTDNQFAAVASVGVLEHVRETGGSEVGSLRELKRVLKPGGHLICYHLPNKFSLIEGVARFFPDKHHHKYKYDKSTVLYFCSEAGLELLRVQRYGFLPRNMWGEFPSWIRNSRPVAFWWDLLDALFGHLFNIACQNCLFVARKPLEGN